MMVCIHGNRSEEKYGGNCKTDAKGGQKKEDHTETGGEKDGYMQEIEKWSCPISTISWMKRSWNSFEACEELPVLQGRTGESTTPCQWACGAGQWKWCL